MTTSITVLVENTAAGQGLLAEHGLAVWIERHSNSVLMDTGQGAVLASNAYRLQVPLYEADSIVLSHGHYDHTGGLAELLRRNQRANIFAHPDCLTGKYARRQDSDPREVGMPNSARLMMMDESAHRWEQTVGPQPIADGLMTTGAIPRVTDFEDTGGPFYLDRDCHRPDPLQDDQAVFFESSAGIVVLLGCAHAGVINTLLHIRKMTGRKPIHAVAGGMHLVNASPDRLRRTIDELRRLKVERLGPAHCTGSRAVAALWNAFPDQCFDYHVGTRLEFGNG